MTVSAHSPSPPTQMSNQKLVASCYEFENSRDANDAPFISMYLQNPIVVGGSPHKHSPDTRRQKPQRQTRNFRTRKRFASNRTEPNPHQTEAIRTKGNMTTPICSASRRYTSGPALAFEPMQSHGVMTYDAKMQLRIPHGDTQVRSRFRAGRIRLK